MTPDPDSDVRACALVAVRHFLDHEAGFAQLVTISPAGFPVGRTVGARVRDDWTVDLVQRGVHRRLGQLRRNPRVELIWAGSPAPGSRNDHPAVYDFGLQIPRVVLLRGTVEFMSSDWTVRTYRQRTRELRDAGLVGAPQRTAENVAAELAGLLVHPVRLRAEGFGAGAQDFTWEREELH